MRLRYLLLLAASASGLGAGLAHAETSSASEASSMDELVVTGSRAAPRSRLDTVAPVDVVPSAQLTQHGNTELAQTLATVLPSLNFTRPAVTDGTDTIRPATLRGLSPDETLVLVNSKRRHLASLVNLNGSIGYGSGATDLNTIPTAAIGTVEVLRDGASAQYGSDAIAGVINLRLREARSGGEVSVTVGQYDTDVHYKVNAPVVPGVTLPTHRHLTDGETTTIDGWSGLPLGAGGFLTVSGEAKVQQHTTRAGPDPRPQYTTAGTDPRELGFNRFDNWYGDPKLSQYTLFANAGYDLAGGVRLYGWASFQYRDAISAANFRRALQSNAGSNIQSVYPNGFLPKIEGKVYDGSAAAGATFNLDGWDADASLVYGINRFNFGVIDSINTSLGPTSPHDFDAGALQFQQLLGDFSLTRRFDGVNVAAGLEVRYENYQIIAGEPASYEDGGFVTQTGATPAQDVHGVPGAEAFSGFSPANATDAGRWSEALYLDVEDKLTDALDVDLAVRGEHYSDFGSVLTGKFAARYDLSPHFALRAAVSNGFRAPSLQQSHITTTSTNFVGGLPVQTVLIPPGSPQAKLIGASPLKPEKSVNVSGGGVFRAGAFSLTVDGFFIRIKDRVVLSDILQQANVIALFPPASQIGGVRFFTNGVDSETKGVEAVATYHWTPPVDLGRFDLSASVSYNQTDLTAVRSTPVLSALNPAPVLLPHFRTATLTDGQPKTKGALAIDWTRGILGATAKATYYGDLLQPSNTSNPAGDYRLQAKTLVDLEARVTLHGAQLALGVDNLFDTYPTTPPYILNGVTISSNGVGDFPEYSPFGFQGRFVYARASYRW
ncbi:MAG TPA: TonB-dependent receptor [Caulobacteraceae bacterium]|nr:TonB-dependent receptor [Caulobacteraceae bacterium]